MDIRVLYAPVVKPELPQCEANRHGQYCKSWEDAHPDKRCMHRASYSIEGKNFCKRHAGIMALEYLTKGTKP